MQDRIWVLEELASDTASLLWDRRTNMLYRSIRGLHFLVPLGQLQSDCQSAGSPPALSQCWVKGIHGQHIPLLQALDADRQQNGAQTAKGACAAIFASFRKQQQSHLAANETVNLSDLLKGLCETAERLAISTPSWRYFMRMVGTEISLNKESQVWNEGHRTRREIKTNSARSGCPSIGHIKRGGGSVFFFFSFLVILGQMIWREKWSQIEKRCLAAELLALAAKSLPRLAFSLERLRLQARSSPVIAAMLRDAALNSRTISVDALMELMLNGSLSWDMQDFRCLLAIVQVRDRRETRNIYIHISYATLHTLERLDGSNVCVLLSRIAERVRHE